jgi:hypothetical protein
MIYFVDALGDANTALQISPTNTKALLNKG